jgi:hypothetical protein
MLTVRIFDSHCTGSDSDDRRPLPARGVGGLHRIQLRKEKEKPAAILCGMFRPHCRIV